MLPCRLFFSHRDCSPFAPRAIVSLFPLYFLLFLSISSPFLLPLSLPFTMNTPRPLLLVSTEDRKELVENIQKQLQILLNEQKIETEFVPYTFFKD
ncbi:hypothetical protein KA405_03845 [Patescibacteria group bacterium]|nr:hypothetical protein [Patescibacteria group bacterium]